MIIHSETKRNHRGCQNRVSILPRWQREREQERDRKRGEGKGTKKMHWGASRIKDGARRYSWREAQIGFGKYRPERNAD